MKALAQLLRKAMLFLLVSIAVYTVAMVCLYHVRLNGQRLLFRTGDYYQRKGGLSHAMFQELDTTTYHDAVVIGSSHAYRGYDPRHFAARGIRLFNMGTSAQTPMNSYYLLRNYISRRNCGLVIFDLYENTMVSDGMESTSELSRNATSDKAALEMCLALKDPRAINLMTLRWLSTAELVPPLDVPHWAGYAERTDSLRHDAPPPFVHGEPLVLDSMQVRYFRKCLAYCADQGLPIVLVTHYFPVASDHERHARFHDFVERETAGTGIRYIDLAYAGRVDDHDHFYDHNHLNAAGVALFNAQLLDSLGPLPIAPPARR